MDYTSAVVIIGPDKTYTFRNLRLRRIALPPAERDALKKGTVSVYCYGFFEYRDIFGKTHPTNYCRRLDLKNGEWFPVGEYRRNESR